LTKTLLIDTQLIFLYNMHGLLTRLNRREIREKMKIKEETICDGVHIMAIGKEEVVPDSMKAAGLI